ncbi:MAG: hypothetical protein Q4F57_05050 [Weeksellaceae bacterium]|nr:hypothetical protein [Weeksellaceae bacterium]
MNELSVESRLNSGAAFSFTDKLHHFISQQHILGKVFFFMIWAAPFFGHYRSEIKLLKTPKSAFIAYRISVVKLPKKASVYGYNSAVFWLQNCGKNGLASLNARGHYSILATMICNYFYLIYFSF